MVVLREADITTWPSLRVAETFTGRESVKVWKWHCGVKRQPSFDLAGVGSRRWSNLQGRLQGSGQAEMCIVCALRREEAEI